MKKMKMESMSVIENNIEQLKKLFPLCVTEGVKSDGTIGNVVNYEVLQAMLGELVMQGDEKYEFSWVGKRGALREANEQIEKTLRPRMQESIEWNTTENIYIKGDNLEALKLIQESYLNSVKVIYIDPPYNTGSDFIYKDNFCVSGKEYENEIGAIDEKGIRLFRNSDSNGRFHSDWCSMIYARLLLARNILTEDGVIFISIDDHEQENLKKIADEVFGESNFIAQVIWERAFSPVNLKKHFSESHDYIICYAKNIQKVTCNGLPRNAESDSRYSNPDNDARGPWTSGDLSVGPVVESKVYEIITPSGRKVLPPSGYCWRLDKSTFDEYVRENKIWFGEDGNNVPRIKRFLNEVKQGITPMTVWKFTEVGHSQDAKQKLKQLFDGNAYFDYPKPVELIKRCIQLYSDKDSIIMDFFSGTATTAHAIMELNVEDGGNRKFILVQLDEACDEKSIAYKNGYSTICDIGIDRMKRAKAKITMDNPKAKFDGGFRVFYIDDSNMTDVNYSADEYSQGMLSMLESNIKADRTDLDLLFGCLLEWGLPLSQPHTSETIEGCTVHTYNDGDLIACFDENIPDSVIKTIAMRQPLRAVFRDSSFTSSPSKINVGEVFKLLAPDTRVKVI